jgi:uncharacterized protein (DUF305 family)
MAVVVGAVGLVVGLGIGALAWMGGDHDGSMRMDGGSMGSTAGMTTQGGAMSGATMNERAFIAMMVPHHESAVAMARMAEKKAQHVEVRRLARDIIDSQDREIAQMTSWYERWYGVALASDSARTTGMGMTGLGMDGMGMSGTDMSALESTSGAAFDRRFLAMMIPHHASAVMMAAAITASGPRSEVSDLADRIIAAQSTEIGRMQAWRVRWYPPRG